jgi:hypothetical protein
MAEAIAIGERCKLRPLHAMPYSPLSTREGLFDHHPEHDGCGEAQGIPAHVLGHAAERLEITYHVKMYCV